MKIIARSLVLLILIFASSQQIFAQGTLLDANDLSTTSIDSYTDAQLIIFTEKLKSLKISDEAAIAMLRQKNLPEPEVEKLKGRLLLINSKVMLVGNKSVAETVANNRNYDAAGKEVAMQAIPKDPSIFGSELFTGNSLVFEPNLRIPTPASYILGPDDEITVRVYGLSEQKYNLKVDEEGDIYIPNVGPLYVNGLTIEDATKTIRAKLASTIYRAINSGQTKVQVTLGKIRSIRVTVIGQATKPGTYTVSSLTTLYNLLYLAGGPNEMGSYRTIEVIRGNEVKRVADLYAFLVSGNQSDNVLLQEGDVVRIPYYKNRTIIEGNIKRPGKYELLNNETFSSLLGFSGGFNDFAYRGAVSVIRITDKEKKIIDLNSAQYDSFTVKSGDQYAVGTLQDRISNMVTISGSVVRPGNYELENGLTLRALLAKAGGLMEDAFTDRISIFRYQRNNIPQLVSVNLDSLERTQNVIILQKNDSIAIHSIFDFRDQQYVSVEGNVRQAGNVQWRENLTLMDVLLAAGGIAANGDSSTIEISRRIKHTEVGQVNHRETEMILVDLNSQSFSRNIRLMPFDLIIVKELPGFTTQRTVMVLGDVKIPGKYSLQQSGEQISNIIQRVGGFKASADSNVITIRRLAKSNLTIQEREVIFERLLNINNDSLNNNLRNDLYKKYDLISVDLQTALKNPGSSENLVLEDGDILTIERRSNLVKISGEVYYPTIIPYKKNATAKYYIEQAGSFTSMARKSGALVIYPDGKAKSVKSFLWFKTYPEVTPRSEVVVPQKNKTNRTRLGAGEWALLVSALGIVANVIITSVK